MSAFTKQIVIGIPTFRRPQGLARLLASISLQKVPFTPHIVVADNEGEGGVGLRVVEEFQGKGFPFPLTGIAVAARGISQVRNALIKTAFRDLSADALVMVDDDVQVEPGWLGALVAMQEETSADVVGGRVMPDFEGCPPPWSRNLSVYWRSAPPAGVVPLISGTTTVLLARSIHKCFFGERFDPAFSLTGGEDKEYFVRLRKKGARFAFSPAAVAFESFGKSRATRHWALQRAFRIGSGDARIFRLHLQSIKGWLIEITKLVAALALAPFLFLVLAWSDAGRMRVCLILARQAGKINGWLGSPPKVYETIHGS